MEKQFGINVSEQQIIFDLLVVQVETLYDVYGPEELVREDQEDEFIGYCRILERYRDELGYRLPETQIFLNGWKYYQSRK